MPFSEIGLLIAQILSGLQLPELVVQPAPEEVSQIGVLISEVATMQQDIIDATARCLSLGQYLTTLQRESESLLNQDGAPAMDALLVLVNHIESLHQIMQDQSMSALTTYRNHTSAFGAAQACMPFVNICKSQSRVVFGHFQSLHEKAKSLTQKFTELTTDFTFEITMAQERIDKLRDIVQVAGELRNGVENQRENWNGQKAVAEAHVEQARATVRSAESKRDSMESARVVRNLLTFGLGEVFDLFDLNEEIEGAERTIASAEQNVRACEQSIQRAIVALQQINGEVEHLNTLGDTVLVQEMTLQDSVTHGQELRTHTIDLTNASLNVSLFVGTLAAKSETFAVQHTAQEFAQSVLTFGRLMASEGMLNDLLVQHDSAALQSTLDMIAQSDNIAEDGRLVETQEQAAIEDMM